MQKKDLANIHKNNIIFYCTHRNNTINKKLKFKKNPCNAKITYKRNEDHLNMNIYHNEVCIVKKPQIYENIVNVNKNIYEFLNYKEDLIKFLNLNPLITFSSFKKYVIKKYIEGKFDCSIKKIHVPI